MEDKKKELIEREGFKCKKCGYYSPMASGLEANLPFQTVLCSICNTFAPVEKENFDKYVNESTEWQNLETFRNSGINKASHQPHKTGMIKKSQEGKLVARPPFGYVVKKGELVVDEETGEDVRAIFKEFLAGKSLNQISKSYGMSVNGIKKILKNFSYLGKIKFDSQISQGTHKSLITPELFNAVQARFEELKKKRKVDENLEEIKEESEELKVAEENEPENKSEKDSKSTEESSDEPKEEIEDENLQEDLKENISELKKIISS